MLMVIHLYLFWGTWQDVKKRKVSNTYLWLGTATSLIYRGMEILKVKSSLKEWLAAMIPGILMLIIAKSTKEKIGYGDGWLLLILGNVLNIIDIWYVLQIAVLLVTLFSIILIIGKKVCRDDQIPFLPFLWMGYIIWRGLQYG